MAIKLLNTEKAISSTLVPVFPANKLHICIEEDAAVSLERKQLQLLVKRIFDIVLSSLLILFFSPVLIIVAAIIKLTSKGPILYSNERVGYKDINFRCFKFRSMVADQSVKAVDYAIALEGQEKGILHKTKNDSRITWIGKIIRKTSIDELPQLFNVLKGDMSIIGPRPLVPFMLKHLPEFKQTRCLVRPGITGLWQIRDRVNNTSAEFMIEHDIEYIKNYSLLLDLKILAKTPIVVLTGEGAY
jgi:lipopolysaccharide/colanic/teichoic acid biosynthesis glycosyltransferase